MPRLGAVSNALTHARPQPERAQFGTRFEEMDALSGRTQTTHGIWLAQSTKVAAPPTLVMDLEGSDGRERGEDDTSFERQVRAWSRAPV